MTTARVQIPKFWKPLVLTALTVSVTTTTYEYIKVLFFPHTTTWQSHTATILFCTILATMAAYLMVRRERASVVSREAFEALRSQNQIILETVDIGIYLTDMAGRITFANPAGAKLLGWEPRELLGQLLHQVLHQVMHHSRADGKAYPLGECPIHTALQAGSSRYSTEDLFWRKDGENFYAEWSSLPLREDGCLMGSVLTLTDITERKKAEQALRTSEFRFRRLMDSNLLGISVANLKGDIFEANDESLRIFGYTRADLDAGRVNWARSTPREHLEADARAIRQLTASGVATPWEKEMLQPNGTRVPVMIGVAMLDGENCLAFTLDLTERKKVEDQLQQSEERFRQLAENIREVFWMTDVDKGRMIYISPAYEQIWGRSRASLYENPASFVEVIHPDDRNRVIAALNRQVIDGYDEIYRIIQPKGDICWIHDRAFPIKDESGRVYRMTGIAEDITEQRKLEGAVHLSEKMSAVGQLAAGVAHEINNPLGVILGFAQSLVKRVPEDDPISMPLKSIEREALRCKNLVQNLLTFSRQGPARDEAFELPEALSSSLVLIETQARIKSIQLIQDIQVDGSRLRGNRNQIEQVIINLCSNAIDAMPKGGTLTVSSSAIMEKGQPFVRLEVKDTGVGIPEAIQKRIFEPFFTTKEPGKGTGLGLALVHEIVERHQGRIECRSQEGGGTTFILLLPAVQELSGVRS